MTRCSYLVNMNTNGPRDCSSATAIGFPESEVGASSPDVHGFGRDPRWIPGLMNRAFTSDVFLVGPVDGDQGGKFVFHKVSCRLRWSRRALSPRRPYSRVFLAFKTTSEDSFWEQSTSRRSELYPRTSSVGQRDS
jgi:hypothetical protein